MANLNLNRISRVLTDQEMQDLKQQLDNCQQILSFLTELDSKELKMLKRINLDHHNFVQETLAVMNYVDLPLPPHIGADEIAKDLALYEQLQQLIIQVEQLLKRLKDSAALVGSEAYGQSSLVYHLLAALASSSLPGYATAYERLQVCFKKYGRKSDQQQIEE
ncbi:hypothetical protein [Saprospira grandis]|uniref:Uncharacterized protein n=1 Tax=Saprospira grandis (strain Lewin) TaxID=984262 RepID=H6LAJ2_SAPGL|nr:hypothetical protein [Saprospira grandis]AFC25585.1 hypothetical protein SGRA_2857 [Saprospira grandis str. Lewin]